jgi:hypothetical protein
MKIDLPVGFLCFLLLPEIVLSFTPSSLPVEERIESRTLISIQQPKNNSVISLPSYLIYNSSGPCHSEVYIDGLLLHRAQHNYEDTYFAQAILPELSRDMHVISIDFVDSDGMHLYTAVRSHIFHIADTAEPESYYSHIEPIEPYNPELSDEDKAKAVVKDGWLVVMHQNLEFTRIEPIDACEDIGWTTRDIPRRIYDAFQFFNELDILEIRLFELHTVVHKFILIEATRTHSNQPKPLYYEQSKHRFSAFSEQIIHIVVDDLPNSSDPWVLENYQRNAILRGLDRAHPNDLVVIADVDEIPASYVLDALRSCDGPTSPSWLYSRFFNFKFEWEFAGQWKHPQVVRYSTIAPGRSGAVTPQQVRMGAMSPHHTKIESAGWHCSFFSDAEGVIEKVRAFTHQELNREVRISPTPHPAPQTPNPRPTTTSTSKIPSCPPLAAVCAMQSRPRRVAGFDASSRSCRVRGPAVGPAAD